MEAAFLKNKLITERGYYFSPSINVGMLFTLSEEVGKLELQNAFDTVRRNNEILNTKIALDRNGQAFYAASDDYELKVECYANGEKDWREWFSRNEGTPYDLENGELLRAAIFNGNGETAICLLGHHLLGDGLSYAYLVEELIDVLNKRDNGRFKHIKLIGVSTQLPRGSSLGILPRMYIGRLNSRWLKNGSVYGVSDRYSIFREFHKHRTPGMRIVRIGKVALETLADKCAMNGVSINDALVMAFLYSMYKNSNDSGNSVLEFGIPVNVRNELEPPIGKEMGNFVSGITVKHTYDRDKTFWENARAIKGMIRKKLLNKVKMFAALHVQRLAKPGLMDSLSFLEYGSVVKPVSLILGRILGIRLSDKVIGLTNLGRMRIGNDGDRVKLRSMVFIPPAYAGSVITIGTVTCNGVCEICIRYFSEEISGDSIDKIAEDAVAKINEFR